jgi:hypothetical protein
VSSLEASITLDDVFAVVGAKRVPLAAELAGYLALEIADGTDAGSGEVDPKTVFISEEGSVALVRPKRDIVTGDAEASVRTLLTRLLEAGGSSTPALGQAARRKPGNGLPALVEELEAALIPVNRAAGRRALARLSREVKRVTQGVGRNASVAPVPAKAPEGAKLAKVELVKVARPVEPPPPAAPPVEPIAEAPKHDPFAPTPVAPKPKTTSIPPPPVKSAPPPAPPPQPQRTPGPPSALHVAPPSEAEADEQFAKMGFGPPVEPSPMAPIPAPVPTPAPAPAPTPTPRRAPKNDDVDALLNSFEVSGGAKDDQQLARDLKGIAGLSPTPPNPRAKSIADLAEDVGKAPLPSRLDAEGDSVEALLAMADASLPAPVVSANQALPPVAKVAPSRPGLGEEPAPPSTPAPDTKKKEVFRRTSAAESVPASVPTKRRASAAEPPHAPKTSMVLLVLALVALGAATVGIYKYAPHVFVGHKPLPPPAPSMLTPPPHAAQCKLTLQITDAPARSEILLRVGQAPVDVDHMPVGARLELVATAEGYAPKRAVIAAEAQWDKGSDGKPRIEVPIQLDASKAKPGTVDPWPAAEPNSQVGGSGTPGTVHVVSNVRGAEIWLLAGLGPDAKVEQKCDGDVDVLIAGPPENPKDPKAPPVRKRLHVSDKEVAAAAPDSQGNKTVSVSANK